MESMQVNDSVYTVVRLLGKGKGGYSYLVTDGQKQYVCKQIHHEPCSYYQFGNKLESELRDYARLREVGIRLPELYAVDEGRERLLKQYIAGDTVYDMVALGPLPQQYWDQVKAMCAKLYPAGLNIDYFSTNFIMQDGLLYYIDYECNGYMEQWDFEHWGWKYWQQTPEYWQHRQQNG